MLISRNYTFAWPLLYCNWLTFFCMAHHFSMPFLYPKHSYLPKKNNSNQKSVLHGLKQILIEIAVNNDVSGFFKCKELCSIIVSQATHC